MNFNGFDGLSGIDGIGGMNGANGLDPMSGLIWQLFEQSGEPGYYMLLNGLAGIGEDETDHRRD